MSTALKSLTATDNVLIRRENLAALDGAGVSTGESIGPVSPGDVLLHGFIKPLNLSARQLSDELGMGANYVTRLINDQTRVTADTALRLAKRFGTTPAFWMGLQTDHDLELAQAGLEHA